jgi:glutathione S-transferase
MRDCPIVYGAAYSVYVQAVRLTLWAKQVPYELVEVDVFAAGGPPPEHLARHPFGRIPAFKHNGLQLYETAPICRYIDESFEGPQLQPPTLSFPPHAAS